MEFDFTSQNIYSSNSVQYFGIAAELANWQTGKLANCISFVQ
jgi:hypothetical protein